MVTAEQILNILAANDPKLVRSSLEGSAKALAEFFASAAATDGADVPDAAKEAAKRLVSISDVEGDVKVGDIVLGNQLKIVAPEKAPSVVDVTADFPFQAKLVNSFQPFGPGQVQAAAISALQLDGLDLADPLMAWKVAGALLRADRPAMTAFLVALTSAYLDRVACPGGVPALALYIWPFSWVPAKARAKLAAIPKRPPDKRGVALNSANHETALAYVRCAPLPQDMVKRVPVGPPDGEQTLADLVQRVSTLIENEVGAPVHERLAFHIGRGRIVFVVLQWAIDREALLELRARFPEVTFVILAGPPTEAAPFPSQGLADVGVEYLEPALAYGIEGRVNDDWWDLNDRMKNTCDGLPGGSP